MSIVPLTEASGAVSVSSTTICRSIMNRKALWRFLNGWASESMLFRVTEWTPSAPTSMSADREEPSLKMTLAVWGSTETTLEDT